MRFYLLICNIFISNILFCQQYTVENISTQEGLSNNSVQSVYKDSRGILWIGTASGLSKIINNKIQNLTPDVGLAPNGCWAISEDQNHNMWFGSFGGGITFFDGKKFTVIDEKKGLCNNNVRKLINIDDKLFAGTDNGISVININTKKIVSYTDFKSYKNIKVTGLIEYNKECYIGTYNEKAGVWKLCKDNKLIQINSEPWIVSLKKINDSIILHSDYKLKCYSLYNFLRNNKYNSIPKGAIWDYSMTNNGCFVAEQDFGNSTGGIYKILKNELKNYNILFNINSKQIWCLYFDKKFNQLFVGTSDKGLFIVDLNNEITYINLNNEDVKYILKIDSTKIFLTSSKVILEIKNKIKKIKSSELINFAKIFYKKNKNSIPSLNYYDSQIRKNNININSYEVYNHNLFISTTIGLYKISKQGVIVSFFPIGLKYFKMLGETELIGFRDYLPAIYFEDIKQPNNYTEFDLKNNNNPKDIFSISSIANRLYLISYTNGLYRYEDKKSYSYLLNNEWSEKELITSCKNEKGKLIVASQKGDVYIIGNSKKFAIIKKIKNSEINGTSINFLESYKDYTIIGTNLGLNFYKNGTNIFLDEKNGIKNKIFNSAFLSKDTLFIATTNGYYKLNLKKIVSPKKQNLKLFITKLDVNHKSVFNNEMKWYSLNKSYVNLPYNKNTLSIEFEPQNVSNKSKLIYSFKVQGLKNSSWRKWSNDASILLPFLPDGTFDILVKTKDLTTGAKYNQRLLSVTITPPFWKTIPFILLLSITALLLIYLYIKNRITKVIEKNEIQKRLIETKMEALQSQMNPHFTFNAMNSIQNYIVKNKMEDALEYLVDFSRLIRQTLDNSIKNTIKLDEEIQYLQAYVNLENKRYFTPINFEITLSKNIDSSEIDIPPMLLQPFVENCFVHAFNTKIEHPYLKIDFNLSKDILIITILDNGVGFNKDLKIRNSLGINLVEERIKLFSSKSSNSLIIDSKLNEGTKVTLQITISTNK